MLTKIEIDVMSTLNQKDTFTIVIPNYNEESAISRVVQRVLLAAEEIKKTAGFKKVEIIVVDDGSTDQSLAALQKFHNEITIVKLDKNQGYGGALKAGFFKSTGELVAFLDMDCTYDPLDLIKMLNLLIVGQFDFVSGDRLSQLSHMPISRRIGNIFFVLMIKVLFKRQVNDACSGIRIFRASYISFICKHLPDDLSLALGMTLYALCSKKPFTEIPVSYANRIGESKLKLVKDGFRFYWLIVKFWWQKDRWNQLNLHGN